MGRKRRAALDNGYRPIAVHTPWSGGVPVEVAGKHPLTEVVDGARRPWTEGHSHSRLMHTTAFSANTGLVLGGADALVALDLDAAKGVSDADQHAFTTAVLNFLRDDPVWPPLKGALIRLREPASVVLLLRTDPAMTKSKVAGQLGQVELLGCGQHVVISGWHPKSLNGPPVKWHWHRDRSPWTVPVTDLPVIPAAEMSALMQRIAASGILGAPRNPPAGHQGGTGQPRSSAYAATDRLRRMLDGHNGLVKPAVAQLIAEVGAEGCGRHDALVAVCGRLVLQKWTDEQALEFLVPLINTAFSDGDWRQEIESALRHARKRSAERTQGMRSVTWKG